MILGSHSSGKTSLIKHFERYVAEQNGSTESENDDLDDDDADDDGGDEDDDVKRFYKNNITKNGHDKDYHNRGEINGKINGNSIVKPELTIKFKEARSLDIFYPLSPLNIFHPDAYIVVYAVNSR